MSLKSRLIIGISGASGAVYGVRLLQALQDLPVETHLVMSKAAEMTLAYETEFKAKDVRALADHWYPVADVGAAISSGSFQTLGMIIAPCSVRSMAEIATGVTTNLLTRAADVVLKERRRLVLITREAPLNLAHIRNMASVTEMGGVIFPPVPAFYSRAKTIDDLVNHTVGRVLDLFGVAHDNIKRWQGMKHDAVKD
jgi:4-hydroxy-3-polyprenylbenzoate decarboxylase